MKAPHLKRLGGGAKGKCIRANKNHPSARPSRSKFVTLDFFGIVFSFVFKRNFYFQSTQSDGVSNERRNTSQAAVASDSRFRRTFHPPAAVVAVGASMKGSDVFGSVIKKPVAAAAARHSAALVSNRPPFPVNNNSATGNQR